MRLEHKVALITGGARGNIGAALARLFAGAGAKVAIGARRDEEGRHIEAEVNEAGGDCLFVHLDVTSEADWQHAVAEAMSRFGKLDILVNNAAVNPRVGVEDTTTEVWDRVMDINVRGVFLGTKVAIPGMRRAGGGAIVNISSVLSLVGSASGACYDASKGAVRIFYQGHCGPLCQRGH